jgi:hypothetical protein
MFVYEPGTTCFGYQDADFEPLFEITFDNQADEDDANDKCSSAPTPKQKDICIYDYVVTGNSALAAGSLASTVTVSQSSTASCKCTTFLVWMHG